MLVSQPVKFVTARRLPRDIGGQKPDFETFYIEYLRMSTFLYFFFNFTFWAFLITLGMCTCGIELAYVTQFNY